MNEIQKVFNFRGSKVRTVVLEGEPWFLAKDVCEVLGLLPRNINVWLRNLPEEMKGTYPTRTLGGTQQMNYLSEAGLYSLTMRSNKPQALIFQNWIASEVLPSIRRTGSYRLPSRLHEAGRVTGIYEPQNESLLLAQAVLVAQEMIDRLSLELAEVQPKAKLYDRIMREARRIGN